MSILLKEKDIVIDSKRKPLAAIYAEDVMSIIGVYVYNTRLNLMYNSLYVTVNKCDMQLVRFYMDIY